MVYCASSYCLLRFRRNHHTALPTELHDIPCSMFIASPKPSELFCHFGHPFLSSFAFFVFVLYVATWPQPYSAITLIANFPRPYTTTYLSCMLRLSRNRNPIPWGLQIRKLPRRLRLYLRVEYRLFPLHLLLLVSFDAVSAQAYAILPCQ